MGGIPKLLGALALSVLATSANALSVNYDAGATVTSTPGAVTFWDFNGIANTSIGTVTAALVGTIFGSNPVPSDSSNIWGNAFGTQAVTVNLTNPVTYVGFTWGTPDGINTVDVYDSGNNLLNEYTGTGLNITQFHDNPGTGFFNITAGPGESIAKLILTSTDANFEVDNFAAGTSTTPLPAALPMFMGGAGVIGLLARRRKQKLMKHWGIK